MTIMVGIRCEEGIVMAADSRATMGILGKETTRQDIETKIEIPQNQPVIIGFSIM